MGVRRTLSWTRLRSHTYLSGRKGVSLTMNKAAQPHPAYWFPRHLSGPQYCFSRSHIPLLNLSTDGRAAKHALASNLPTSVSEINHLLRVGRAWSRVKLNSGGRPQSLQTHLIGFDRHDLFTQQLFASSCNHTLDSSSLELAWSTKNSDFSWHSVVTAEKGRAREKSWRT